MHLELRCAVPEGGECGYRRQFAAFQIQTRPLIDIAEGKFDGVAGQIGRNRTQAVDDRFACGAIDFLEFGQTGFVTRSCDDTLS